jgi:putative NADH-flavin reductase
MIEAQMNILIIGASRGIGRVLLEEALKEDHRLRVLARNPEKVTINDPRLSVVQGDVRDRESVLGAAQGQDLVCSCIGVPITFKKVDLFSIAAANLIAAVEANPGQKLIAVTGIGAGDSRGHGGFLYDKMFQPLLLSTIYADKDIEEQIIKASDVPWLIVRPAGLTNGPRTGTYRILTDLRGVTSKRISRRDVADFILGQAANPTQFGKTPLLTY